MLYTHQIFEYWNQNQIRMCLYNMNENADETQEDILECKKINKENMNNVK